MERLASLFSSDDNAPDYEALRAQSMYPDLIGKTVDHGDAPMPFWMHCGCGMMVITSAKYHGKSAVCVNCTANAKTAAGKSEVPAARAMSRRAERRMTWAVVAFVLVLGTVLGSQVADAPSRSQIEVDQAQLD